MLILGFDAGLANCGYAIVDLTPDSEECIYAGTFSTKPSPKKRGILVAHDVFRRARELSIALQILLEEWDIKAVCAEAISFPQNSTAATKVAISWGILAAECARNDLPIVQPSPQFIKKQLCEGNRSATKQEVEDAVCGLYPNSADVLTRIPKVRRDHAVDAYAAVIVSLESEVIRAIRKVS